MSNGVAYVRVTDYGALADRAKDLDFDAEVKPPREARKLRERAASLRGYIAKADRLYQAAIVAQKARFDGLAADVDDITYEALVQEHQTAEAALQRHDPRHFYFT